MPENTPEILVCEKAWPVPAPQQTPLNAFDLHLPPGALCLVVEDPAIEELPLADAASGLAPLKSGHVLFLGQDWRDVPMEAALLLRAKIGRVFNRDCWISNLDVIENVTLAQRHHTRRAPAEIAAEAQVLARACGLPEIPAGRPALVPRRDLRRAEWVRAFIGQPQLICLERPGAGVATEHLACLAELAEQACRRGAGVLWITDDEREIKILRRNPRARIFCLQGAQLAEEGAGG